MTKEFGKLSTDQIRQLVALLPEIESLRKEFLEDIKIDPKARETVEGVGVWWALLYEIPFEQHLAVCFKAIGLDKFVREAAKSEDPPGEVLKWAKDESLIERLKPVEGFKLFNAINLVMSVERSLESLLVWGRYLNELVAAAREGDDGSLFKAVRVDPSVVSCPSAGIRISEATIRGDRSFLRALGHALQGRTQKQAKYLREVRLAVQALHDAGMASVSDQQLRELFLKKPEIYKAPPSASPEKALRKHFHAARRKSTT